jgi:hypothetical protein
VEEPPPAFKKPVVKRKIKLLYAIAGVAALLVLGGGGYFVWTTYISPPPPPPPPPRAVVKPKPAPAAAPAVATTPAATAPVPAAAVPAAPAQAVTTPIANAPAKSAGPATPSETLNNLAKAPVNAINKAQDVANARRGSDQVQAGAIPGGEDMADKRATTPATPDSAAKAAKAPVTATGSIAPGVTGTISDVQAVPDANPAFRTFVANAKVTGVIGGVPPKVLLNGRLMRAGEIVDSALGVTFDSIDPDRKLLIFKDKTGATVTRKY